MTAHRLIGLAWGGIITGQKRPAINPTEFWQREDPYKRRMPGQLRVERRGGESPVVADVFDPLARFKTAQLPIFLHQLM